MSTISPRPSITSARTPTPTGSRRPSLEASSLATSNTSTPTAKASPSLAHRKNRAALRDYYNLRPAHPEPPHPNNSQSRSVSPSLSSRASATHPAPVEAHAELDSPNFDPSAYITHLLSTSSLSTILKAENSLISDIRTLDGERKALVYDNYSKLIKAVETIGKMRASIDERGQPVIMTKTLGPAVGFVAETAVALSQEQEESRRERVAQKQPGNLDRERETVRWVLASPKRLKKLLDDGKGEEADRDWKEVEKLLTKWKAVKGVDELRTACEGIMMKGE
ncbi:Vps51 superfamily domain-containing protein [Histoplasma ohiense]|nr:Vps51 superfamily domain-containing protein [Histoplasma ohiense (nom. inval.)]